MLSFSEIQEAVDTIKVEAVAATSRGNLERAEMLLDITQRAQILMCKWESLKDEELGESLKADIALVENVLKDIKINFWYYSLQKL